MLNHPRIASLEEVSCADHLVDYLRNEFLDILSFLLFLHKVMTVKTVVPGITQFTRQIKPTMASTNAAYLAVYLPIHRMQDSCM
jgi:hypothetical protein